MSVTRLVLAAGLLIAAASAPALAGGKQECPPNTVKKEIESRTPPCPDGTVVQRACCTNPQGRRRCDAFPKCPRKSPS